MPSDSAPEAILAFAAGAAVLSVAGYLPYMRDIIRGRVTPCRASWLIWSVLGSIALGSLIYEGATTSLAFAGAQVGGTLVIFALSVVVGRGAYLRRADWLILMAAGAGLGLWYQTADAAYALAITISISLLGGVMTVCKIMAAPRSETVLPWLIFLTASLLGVLSVRTSDPVLLAYPVYLVTLYSAITLSIVVSRMRAATVLS